MFKKLHYLEQLPLALGPQPTAESLSITFASDAPGLPITLTNDTNYGVVGANTLRTAAQIGNATGAAAFGTGTRSAQVLRVTIATDDVVPVAQSGTWNINDITGTVSLPTGAATETTLSAVEAAITGTLTVQATNLDIRDLSSASDSIASVQSGTWNVGVTSSTLPSGAATETTLSALNAKFNSLGQKTMANSAPVVLASDQTAIPVTDGGGTITVDGTVAASNFPSTVQTASGTTNSNTLRVSIATDSFVQVTNFPTTLSLQYNAPDSGTIRVAAMMGVGTAAVSNSNPVPISDAGGAITVDGTVAVSNLPATVDTNTGAAGSSTIRIALANESLAQRGRSYVTSTRNDYSSVNVTTGAWVQLVASTSADINAMTIFDSSGRTLEIGTGGSGSETRVLLVTPGGFDAVVPLRIAAGTRISIKAVDANATTGFLMINYIG